MSNVTVQEKVCTCPSCLADNTLVSSELPPTTEILCSRCGHKIGSVADMRDVHVSLAPAE